MIQQMQMVTKATKQTKTDSDMASYTSYLDTVMMSKVGCATALGLEGTKQGATASPIYFPIPQPAPNTPLAAIVASPIPLDLRDAAGRPYLAANSVVGNITLSKVELQILPTTPALVRSQGVWNTQSQLIIQGEDQNKKSYHYKKPLNLQITMTPFPNASVPSPTFSGQILGCSSYSGLQDGVPLLPPVQGGGAGSMSTVTSTVVDSTGEIAQKQIICAFGSYPSSTGPDGSVICRSLPDCNQPGGALVMLQDDKGNLIPTCKTLTCPGGQVITSVDSQGYVSGCELASKYFKPCTLDRNWSYYPKNEDSKEEKVTRSTWSCNPIGAQICIEDCAEVAKKHEIKGWPLHGQAFDPDNRPRMTTDCATNGMEESKDVSPGYTCKKSGSDDCGQWARAHLVHGSTSCGGTPGYTMNNDGAAQYNNEDCKNQGLGSGWSPTSRTVTDTAANYTSWITCQAKRKCAFCDGGGSGSLCGCWVELSGHSESTCNPDPSKATAYCY